ncbi:MAG: ankyrin repeat domain-containing protein [Comamonadaceae bacterium]|jgi:hypothetical protein|nr:ankyrin repeat domain-containing protein [Comamonadaceae bacterium]
MFLRPPHLLLPLILAFSTALAQPDIPTPRRLIDGLGVTLRQAAMSAQPGQASEAAERAVAEQIAALPPEQRGSLVDADEQGRTPLMQAVSGGYPQVVKALLADAGVRAGIERPDAHGETAWMLANFAPALTLVACQPGALTLERYPLLRPYLMRMTLLLNARTSVAVGIVQALEAAGARPTPEAATKAWLARCPNATPELRQVLVREPLLPALVNESLARQLAFNKALRAGEVDVPQKPPEGMVFNPRRDGDPALSADANRVNCARRPQPALRGALGWSGSLLLRARIATHAGIVETADFTLPSPGDPPPAVVDFFRGTVIRALTGYHCEGNHVFEQDFQFKVE